MKKKALLFISFLILAGILMMIPAKPVLVISDRTDSNKCYYSADGYRNGFIISYTHSVNKGRVHDYYKSAEGNELELYQTQFVSYGAGIPVPVETEGAVFSVKDGCYTISNLHRILPRLNMAVGLVADHSINFGNTEIPLTVFFPAQTGITLQFKRVNLADYIWRHYHG